MALLRPLRIARYETETASLHQSTCTRVWLYPCSLDDRCVLKMHEIECTYHFWRACVHQRRSTLRTTRDDEKRDEICDEQRGGEVAPVYICTVNISSFTREFIPSERPVRTQRPTSFARRVKWRLTSAITLSYSFTRFCLHSSTSGKQFSMPLFMRIDAQNPSSFFPSRHRMWKRCKIDLYFVFSRIRQFAGWK